MTPAPVLLVSGRLETRHLVTGHLVTGELLTDDLVSGRGAPAEIGRGAGSRPWRVLAALLCAVLTASGVAAQADAGEDDEEGAGVERFEVDESSFDSWVFRHGQSLNTVHLQLEKGLELHIDEVRRYGELSDAQRAKLELAGRGDIARYFDEVNVVRRRFVQVRKDRERFNDIWQEIQPLQRTLAAGLFGEKSLFRKTLRRTLSPEHAARYERGMEERNVFRYRAKVEWVVAMLDNVMPLSHEQRRQLVALLLEETRMPRRFGEHDHYVILWQAARVSEDKLKSILDETQWKVLVQQFDRMRGIGDFLEKNGWLDFEDDAATAAAPAAPAAAKE